MNLSGRGRGGTAAVFGLFVAVQAFAWLARQDRWEVLFFVTRETWLLVLLLWAKNLLLAALAGFAFLLLVRLAGTLPEPAEKRAGPPLLALALLAVSLGIALRWIFPEQIPPGLWFDPPFEARALLRNPGGVPWIGGVPLHDDPAASGNRELVSYLYLHFYDGIFRLFGRAETGFLALSALPGCLALLGAFWLASEVFGLSAALLGVSLVSLSRWPLVFSRWSYTASALIPLALLSAAAALASLRTRRLWLAVLSGVFTGLSLHTHSSSWAVAAGLGIFSLSPLRDRALRPLVLSAWTAALLAFAPFGWGYLRHPENLGGRVRDVAVGTGSSGAYGPEVGGPLALPAAVVSNAAEYTGILLFTKDPNPRDGLPGHLALTPTLGLAAMVGLALAAARRSRGDGALFALLLGSLAGGIFSNPGGAPNTIRSCVVVIPALLAAGWLLLRVLTRAEARGRARVAVASAGILAFVLGVETAPFLSRWPEDPRVRRSFCETETRAARLVRVLSGSRVVLEPGALRHPFVFDVLSGPVDPNVPIHVAVRRSAAELIGTPPSAPVWLVTRSGALASLRSAGWRCARGIAPDGSRPELVVAFGRPPRAD